MILSPNCKEFPDGEVIIGIRQSTTIRLSRNGFDRSLRPSFFDDQDNSVYVGRDG
jgi:hypothetical protein